MVGNELAILIMSQETNGFVSLPRTFCVVIFISKVPMTKPKLTYFNTTWVGFQGLFQKEFSVKLFFQVHMTPWVKFINSLMQGANVLVNKVGCKRCCSISSTELHQTLLVQKQEVTANF